MKSLLKKIVIFSLFFIFGIGSVWSKDNQNFHLYVYKPDIQNLNTEKEWIIDFIQNVIFDDINKNSNICVYSIDSKLEENLIIEETDVLYETENVEDFIQNEGVASKAKVSNYNLIINGMYKSFYDLSFKVIDKNTQKILAVKNVSNCSDLDLEAGNVLKDVVVTLLSNLGIQLKNNALVAEDEKSNLEAQQLLAKGLYAQRQGLSIDAMNFFIRAKMKDNTLSKLSQAMNIVSNSVSAEGLGEQSRNLINARKSFIKLLDETESYFEQNIPYVIIYDPELTLGSIDYDNEKSKYLFKSAIALKYDAKEIYDNIVLLYRSQPDSVNWNLDERIDNLLKKNGYLYVQYELLNSDGKRLAVTRNKVALTKNEIYLNEYSFNVPSKYDTKNLVFAITKTKYGEKNYKVSDKNWWNSETGNVDVEKYLIKDFENKYIRPRCLLEESEVRDISYATLPKSISFKRTSKLLEYFGDNLQEVCENYYPNYCSKEDIIYLASEEKEIDSYKVGDIINGNYIISPKMHIGNNSVPWSRKKEKFRQEIQNYNFFDYQLTTEKNVEITISLENYNLLKSAEIKKDEFFYQSSIEVGYWREYSEWSSILEEYVTKQEWIPTGSMQRTAITQKLADIYGLGEVKKLYTQTTKQEYAYTYKETENKFINSYFSLDNFLLNHLIKDAVLIKDDKYSELPADDVTKLLLKKAALRYFSQNIAFEKNEADENDYALINRVLRRCLPGNVSIFIVGNKELKKISKTEAGANLAEKISEDSNYLYFYQTEDVPLRYSQRKRFDIKVPFPQISYTSPDYGSLGFSILEFDFPLGNHIYGGIDGGVKFTKDLTTQEYFLNYYHCLYGFGKLGLNFNLNKGCMFSTYIDSGWYEGLTVGGGIEFTTNKFRYNNFFIDYNIGYVFDNVFTHSDRFYDRLSLGYVITLDLKLKR